MKKVGSVADTADDDPSAVFAAELDGQPAPCGDRHRPRLSTAAKTTLRSGLFNASAASAVTGLVADQAIHRFISPDQDDDAPGRVGAAR
jgi:hypothetical protein